MRRRIKTILICFFVGAFAAEESQAINLYFLDRKISSFEKSHSESAVVIYEPINGAIVYAYNKKTAYNGRFSPGSLIKPLTALNLLEYPEKIHFNPAERVNCPGKFYIPERFQIQEYERSIFNIRKDGLGKEYLMCNGTHGSVDLKEAIIHSCNTYFLTQAAKNPEQIYESLNDIWNFSSGSGYRIPGFTERPFYFRKKAGNLQVMASSIGEGGLILTSPLKIAQIFGAIWSDTPLLRPHEASLNMRPRAFKQLTITHSHLLLIHSALRSVMQTGTLKNFHIQNQRISLLAGKTGSGTQTEKIYATNAWNTIYFVERGNKYILITFVTKGSGAREAAELSRIVLNSL